MSTGGDYRKMGQAASDLATLKKNYSKSLDSISESIINLSSYWENDRYTELKTKFNGSIYTDLKELGDLIQKFSNGLAKAAEELEKISK